MRSAPSSVACAARSGASRSIDTPIALTFERLIRSAPWSLWWSRRDLDPRLGTGLDRGVVVFGARTVVPVRSRCRWTRGRVGLVVLPCFGQPHFDLLDAGLVGGMRRQKFGWLLSFRALTHPDPQLPRGRRIVARLRHVDQSEMIRFRFLRAAERKEDGAGGERAEGGGAELRHAWIPSGQCKLSPDQSELNAELLRQSLATVTRNRVRHFVSKDGSQARVVAREGQ